MAAKGTQSTVGVPAGFTLDPHTGFYHNSVTGQYYEPKSKVYCCFNEGQWYYYDQATKEYQLWQQPASEAPLCHSPALSCTYRC